MPSTNAIDQICVEAANANRADIEHKMRAPTAGPIVPLDDGLIPKETCRIDPAFNGQTASKANIKITAGGNFYCRVASIKKKSLSNFAGCERNTALEQSGVRVC